MKDYISTSEAAKKLGVSRVTIFNRIKKGELAATKVGRNYIIPTNEIDESGLTTKTKNELDNYINKVFNDYEETLQLLKDE
jgi:excisionase family DNA binding protein